MIQSMNAWVRLVEQQTHALKMQAWNLEAQAQATETYTQGP